MLLNITLILFFSAVTIPSLPSNASKHHFNTFIFCSGIGIDWGVVDSGISLSSNDSDYYLHAHRHLLRDNRIIIEYVKNIEKLPATGYTVFLNPLKLYDTCGAPLRMIAVKNPPSGAPGLHATGGMLSVVTMIMIVMMLQVAC